MNINKQQYTYLNRLFKILQSCHAFVHTGAKNSLYLVLLKLIRFSRYFFMFSMYMYYVQIKFFPTDMEILKTKYIHIPSHNACV